MDSIQLSTAVIYGLILQQFFPYAELWTIRNVSFLASSVLLLNN